MAKRMTDSNKWKDPWFSDLPSKYKLFWIYILDDVDHAGIWKVNFKLAQFMIGDTLEQSEVKRIFGDRVIYLTDSYWFIWKFLSFQYPHGLKSTVKAQESVIKILEKHDLIERVRERLGNGYVTVQDIDKDIDILDREKNFKESLRPFLKEYSNDMLKEFFDYWTERGEKDKRMRFEKERSWDVSKRLRTWDKNQEKFGKKKSEQEYKPPTY